MALRSHSVSTSSLLYVATTLWSDVGITFIFNKLTSITSITSIKPIVRHYHNVVTTSVCLLGRYDRKKLKREQSQRRNPEAEFSYIGNIWRSSHKEVLWKTRCSQTFRKIFLNALAKEFIFKWRCKLQTCILFSKNHFIRWYNIYIIYF